MKRAAEETVFMDGSSRIQEPPKCRRVASWKSDSSDDAILLDMANLQAENTSSSRLTDIRSAASELLVKRTGQIEHIRLICKQLNDSVIQCVDENEFQCQIELSGTWRLLIDKIEAGAVLNIVAYNTCIPVNDNPIVISDQVSLFAILEPDALVTATAIANSVYCPRKVILQERFKCCDPGNLAMLVGSIVHELFQDSILRRSADRSDLIKRAEQAVDNNAMTVFALKTTNEVVLAELQPYIENIVSYVTAKKREDAMHVQDIEEIHWTPSFGLRGMIDLSYKNTPSGGQLQTLELKTGKTTRGIDHRAQASLYVLMQAARHIDASSSAAVLYLKDMASENVEVKLQELRGILQLRNNLAPFWETNGLQTASSDRAFILPPCTENTRWCSRCSYLDVCGLMKQQEKSGGITDELADLHLTALLHLEDDELRYFRGWSCAIVDEWRASNAQRPKRSEIWVKKSNELKEKKLSVRSLRCTAISEGRISFTASNADAVCTVFNSGDFVVVSANNSLEGVALAYATVIDSSSTDISLKCDRIPRRIRPGEEMYRIDSFESSTANSIALGNLARLMQDSPAVTNLRKIIVCRSVPTFDKTLPAPDIKLIKGITRSLNRDQMRAIIKCLLAKDYFLIEGLPGTGKTATIVALIRSLCALGKSMLICSYTHSAVDNILLRLLPFSDLQILRLGNKMSVRSEVHRYLKPDNFKTVSIVASTCLAASSHPLIAARRFDYCILDEATQIHQPFALGPLLAVDKFVLIGDSRQLKPIVVSRSQKESLMSESLFSRLAVTGLAVMQLSTQYRMNSDIMRLSNELVYNGTMSCGSEDIAKASVNFTKDCSSEWLKTCSNQSVTFLDTSGSLRRHHQKAGRGQLYNDLEAEIVSEIVQTALLDDIGVICVYKHQVGVIGALLDRLQPDIPKPEISTVDKFQGRDKSVILVSCVWSSDSAEAKSDLFSDIRRLNVILTRAKHKLVIVGDAMALRRFEPVRRLVDEVLQPDQIVQYC